MGYTTHFEGCVRVHPPLTPEEYNFWRAMADHDQREKGPWQIPNPPGYRCQWEPSRDGTSFAWDGNEKFYDSVEWMEVIVGCLQTTGHRCDGDIVAHGERRGDVWLLRVRNNVVTRVEGRLGFAEAVDIPEAEYTEVPPALEDRSKK